MSTPTPGAGSPANAPRPPGWEQTYAELTAAEREGRLAPADLERLALLAYLTGRDVHSTDFLSRAFRQLGAVSELARLEQRAKPKAATPASDSD